MPQVYSQRRSDSIINLIASGPIQSCHEYIAMQANAWIVSKKGRKAKPMGQLELGFLYSDGKLAATLWIEMVPVPRGENPFTPATGKIPGLKV